MKSWVFTAKCHYSVALADRLWKRLKSLTRTRFHWRYSAPKFPPSTQPISNCPGWQRPKIWELNGTKDAPTLGVQRELTHRKEFWHRFWYFSDSNSNTLYQLNTCNHRIDKSAAESYVEIGRNFVHFWFTHEYTLLVSLDTSLSVLCISFRLFWQVQ